MRLYHCFVKFGCQFLHNDSGFIQVEGNYVAVNQNPIAFGVHSSHIEVLPLMHRQKMTQRPKLSELWICEINDNQSHLSLLDGKQKFKNTFLSFCSLLCFHLRGWISTEKCMGQDKFTQQLQGCENHTLCRCVLMHPLYPSLPSSYLPCLIWFMILHRTEKMFALDHWKHDPHLYVSLSYLPQQITH